MDRLSSSAGRIVALPLVLLICLGLSWAFRLLAIKEASQRGASPVELATVATVGIVTILTLINFTRSMPPPIESRHLRFYALAGLVGFGAPFLLEFAVAPRLPALVFIIVVTSTPIWTVLMAAIFRLERTGRARTFGVIAGFVATALIIVGTSTWDSTDGLRIELAWLVASFCIPVLYALYILLVASAWPSDLDSLQGAQGQASVALAFLTVVWLAVPQRNSLLVAPAQVGPVAIIVVCEITALLLLFHLARNHGGSFTAQANYVAVAAGSLLGLVLFDHKVDVLAIAGVLLLVVALRFSSKQPVGEAE